MSAGFVFVTFNNPNERKDADFKTKIRSQAATHSHRVAPRKGSKSRFQVYNGHVKAEPLEILTDSLDQRISFSPTPGTSTPSSSELQPARKRRRDVKPPQKRLQSSPNQTPKIRRASVPARLPSPAERGANRTLRQLDAANTDMVQANIGRKRTHSQLLPRKIEGSVFTGLVRQGKLPNPSYLDASQRDPFDTYPVPYQPWFGWLLDFWYNGTLPKGRRLVKTTAEGMNAYILWSRRFEMTEPALFYTSLFLATGIPVANGMLSVEKALWLRGQAVRALNEALSDPERATSNAIISSVGKIALHEHIYGDREAAHRIHRPAQQRMIAMRGGIEALRLPSITLQLMTWYDALMGSESGVRYFADLPEKMTLPSFSREEAVKVTNVSSPLRHQHPGYGSSQSPELRRVQPIAPTDLVRPLPE